MRRSLTALAAVSVLVLPSTAMAQSAGDEQYADPFGKVKDQGDQQQQQQAQTPAAAPAETAATPAAATGDAVASQQTAAPALPATGLPVGLVAGTGVLLLAAGTTVRRRVS